MNIDYTTPTLILGATFYGCGLAAAMPEALLVESSISVGSDYAFALLQGEDWSEPLTTTGAEEFRQELIARHALENNQVIPAALAPVLADWCRKRNVHPKLGLELIGCKGNIYTFADWCGKKVCIQAEKVIDARCQSNQKLLTAAIRSENPLAEGVYGIFTVKSTPAEKFYTLAMPCQSNDTMQSARKLFAEKWANRPAGLAEAQTVWTASRFSYKTFANAATALDRGLQKIFQYTRLPETDTIAESAYDCVVAGLGTAGIIAAITAARRGLKVLAIEKNFYPGGVWTGGFVARSYIQQTGGLARQLQDLSETRQGYFSMSESLKLELENAAVAAGVKIEYGTALANVEKSGSRVKSVTYRDNTGKLCKVSAYTFIDSTADAVLCRMAGASLSCGRQDDKEFNSYTYSMGKLNDWSFYVDNFDAGRTAQYDMEDFSRSLLAAHKDHLLADYRQSRYCVQLSDNPGVREGLRIVPAKSYTIKDFFASKGKCDEAFFHVISNLDTHAQDLFFESGDYQDWTIAASCWEIKLSIPVPMSVLFPESVHGVIAAARHLGVDHDLGCALRMIALMTAAGELAGNLAFEAQKRNILPHEVKFESIKHLLPETPGVYPKMQSKLPDGDINAVWHSANDDEIKTGLASGTPALAIWNVKQQNKTALAWEIFSQAGEKSPQKINAALALALAGDTRSVPQLMQMIEDDDLTPVNENLRFSAPRRLAATYLLGKLHAAEAVELLLKNLNNLECEKFFGHTVMALIKIADKQVEHRQKIGKSLAAKAQDPSWQMLEQLKGSGASIRRSDGLLRLHIAKALDRWQIPHSIEQTVKKLPLDNHEKFVWQSYK